MNNFKRVSSKILSVILTVTLLLSMLSVPVYAVEPNTPKEEVVYINLNGDGSIKEINVVNIFDLDKDGRIIDYGRYQTIRNMTTTDEIHQSEDMVTIDTKAGKLYYEGKLDENVMPWKFDIHYYINGKEYTAKDIAGKSGSLTITVSITENVNCRGNFFDGYALQASLTLDTKKCKNINATDATIANVGSDKQLTYTILPGKGAEFKITADVSDFEMDAISINGIPLSLNIEVDDDELMDQITELIDAIEKLDNGALELNEGVSDLQNGVQTDFKGGVNELKDGADSIDKGIQSLNQGVVDMQNALYTLNSQSPALTEGSASFKAALINLQSALGGVSVTVDELSALREASSSIKTGIDELVNSVAALQQSVSFEAYKGVMASNGLDIEVLRQSNTAAISSLQAMIVNLNTKLAAMKAAGLDTTELEEQIKQLSDIVALLSANNSSITGTENYLTAVNQNLSALLNGATTLQSNYVKFDAKIGELVDTLSTLAYQMGTLSSAVNTLVSEYEKLDSGITGYTNAVARIVAGYTQISDGAVKLASGSGELKTGAESLYSGTQDLLSGITEIYNGTVTLKDGTSAMLEETSGMDSKINEKIDDLLNSITGQNIELSSFVSDKNDNIKSVQFVIKTESIRMDEVQAIEEETPKNLNFFQKLLKLFGLYE